ncbi:MAG: hypothetical protein KKA32_11245 [Actinobacteria bacterium]|nr:hypothetical protein [Actinomycetota bacterium]
MRFVDLLDILPPGETMFDSALLLAGEPHPAEVRRRLSRWTAAGKLLQLRRGLYVVAVPYADAHPHPFVIANRLQRGSYVSAQAALAFRGTIPEYVPVVTSVSTGRPRTRRTPLGVYQFRHIAPGLLWGAELLEVAPGARVLVATAEKALLDLVHLTPRADDPRYLAELRLDTTTLDLERLMSFAERTTRPKLMRAAEAVAGIAGDRGVEERFEPL